MVDMRPSMESYSLKSVEDIPLPFRSTFKFRYFNSLQSECFPRCFLSNINMVISAPTGSGKTVLFELCILRLLSKFLSRDVKFNHMRGTLKTIYIAPSKALVQEKLRDWTLKFGSLGIKCLEMTGDNEGYSKKNTQESDIILTTPEKFDAVTRHRIKDGGLSFFSDIGLLLIDEVHLLNDPRGAALEAIISRIKMLSRNPEMKHSSLGNIRLVAVSATIPNIEDIANWLMVPPEGMKRFGEEMRPVQLTTKVFGYAAARNDFLFEKRLQNFLFDIIMQHSEGKSALVFCSTRKGAQEAAQCLAKTAASLGHSNPFMNSKEQQDRLKDAALSCSDKQMQICIPYGVAFHNGGLCLKDRTLVESLFLRGDIQILCTTNTLAHGINLPAHLVVIKSTQYFNKEKGQYTEYERSMILQMCGRAGRPPFDDTGTVVIMTRKETVHLYENLLNGCEMVESQLLQCITEHLNAEIVQLTVSDIGLAIEWLKCSYLYLRMKKNPESYGVQRNIPSEYVEKHLQEICIRKINELSTHGMISTDEDGFFLKPLEPGKLMTKYYLKFNTMKDIVHAAESCSLEDALRIICRSEEISWIQLRRNEKKMINDVNLDKEGRLRFHVLCDNGKRKKRIQTREEKIFVLVNDCLTGDPSIHDLSLSQDTNSICSSGCRIAKCMKECFIYRKSYRGTSNSALLAKCLRHRLWETSPYLLKQLTGIGMVTAKAFHSAGINSFESLTDADPRKLEIITGRKFPFGNHIKESLLSLPPKIGICIEKVECKRNGKAKLSVILTRKEPVSSASNYHYADMIVGSEEDNMILFYEKMRAEDFCSPYTVSVLVSYPQDGKVTVKASLIFEEYVGLDVHETCTVIKEINSVRMQSHGSKIQTENILSKEVIIVDDDDCAYSNSNLLPSAPTEASPIPSSSKRSLSPMPSFDLLLDEEEELLDATSFEGTKVVTEHTVFEHIRKKSKNFPTFLKSSAIDSSYDPLLLRRNQSAILTNGPQEDNAILVDSPPAECPSNLVKIQRDLLLDEEEELVDVTSFEDSKLVTEHTVFEHIRKKSKNFPTLLKSRAIDPSYDPPVLRRNQPAILTNGVQEGNAISADSPPAECPNNLLKTQRENVSADSISGKSPPGFNVLSIMKKFQRDSLRPAAESLQDQCTVQRVNEIVSEREKSPPDLYILQQKNRLTKASAPTSPNFGIIQQIKLFPKDSSSDKPSQSPCLGDISNIRAAVISCQPTKDLFPSKNNSLTDTTKQETGNVACFRFFPPRPGQGAVGESQTTPSSDDASQKEAISKSTTEESLFLGFRSIFSFL